MNDKLHLVNDLDLHLVNDFYLFSKFCLMYSFVLLYIILDDLKVIFRAVCHNYMQSLNTCLSFFQILNVLATVTYF